MVLDFGLEAIQGSSLPQGAHGPQQHGHRQRADNAANIGGLVDLELGELNGQEMDDVDFDDSLEATQDISLPQRVYRPQEPGHRQHAPLGDLAPSLRGNHV